MNRRVLRALTVFCLCPAVWSCGGNQDRANTTPGVSTVYASNGARIYYEAKSESGSPVLAASEFGKPPSPALRSCADCHGADGAGLEIQTDSGWVRTPVIQYARLAAADTYAGGRGYSEANLALTLRTGVRRDGYLLSPIMPRWTLSKEDMKDLIDHLKSLGPQPAVR